MVIVSSGGATDACDVLVFETTIRIRPCILLTLKLVVDDIRYETVLSFSDRLTSMRRTDIQIFMKTQTFPRN